MVGYEEERKTMKAYRNAWWNSLTHVQKAEWLLGKVDPAHVYQSDIPRLTLAQVHATLALTEIPKT